MGNERAMEIHVTKKILTIKTSQTLKNVGLCLDVALLFFNGKKLSLTLGSKSCSGFKKVFHDFSPFLGQTEAAK